MINHVSENCRLYSMAKGVICRIIVSLRVGWLSSLKFYICIGKLSSLLYGERCNMSDNCQLTCRMIIVFKGLYIGWMFRKKIGASFRKSENVNGFILLLRIIIWKKNRKETEKCRRLYYILIVIVVVVIYRKNHKMKIVLIGFVNGNVFVNKLW
jgi:hypothetical protein